MKIMCAYNELVDTDLLVPNPRNPNKHNDTQIRLLAKIMSHQGWRSPVVVSNLTGFIVKGHGRLEAAKRNGWTQVPVDRQDYENEADEYADMVADNKIAELSETDLSMVNDEVGLLGPDFDLDLLGIPGFEVDVADKQDELGEPAGNYQEQYAVMVVCENAVQQEEVFYRLTNEGLNCKVVVT